MGRPERAVDPESGPVQHFAYDLRRLRLDAGSPSYRELARDTHYSASALSRAASGRELPSLAVTMAYVGACGGKTAQWQARWQSLACELQPAAAPPGTEADPGRPGPTRPQFRRTAIAGGGLAVVAALAVSGWMMAATLTAAGKPPATAAAERPGPHDGADPKDAGCTATAVTMVAAQIRAAQPVTAAGRTFGPGTVLGTVELRYSARCQAAWARVTPVTAFDHPLSGQEIVGALRPANHGATNWRPGHVEEAYSDLLRTSGGCVSAYAVFLIADGHQASATTPCRQHP